MTRKLTLVPLAAALVFAAGCDRDDEETVDVVLQRAASCEDLETMLKADALAKLNKQIDSELEWLERGDELLWAVDEAGSTGTGGPVGAAEDLGAGGAAPSHSETNTQVEGVDEADIVKTDGNFLYVLHGSELAILSAWPVSELALSSSVAIEGYPQEMFLAGDKLVVFSSVEGDAIFREAGVTPPQSGDYYAPYGASLTKITVLDVSNGQAAVDRELYFEGYYSSSRRVGSKIRAVLQGGYHPPAVSYWPDYDGRYPDSKSEWRAFYEEVRKRSAQRIAAAKLSDLLPARFVRSGGQLSALPPSCGDYYVPPPATTEYGMTQIHSFDLDAPELGLRETQIVGNTHTVYANAEALYVAGMAWSDPMWRMPDWGRPRSTVHTHLHKFDIATDPLAPIYEGSGSVPGTIINQFALDERDGHLRIATTDRRVWRNGVESLNNLYVLDDQGERLGVVGSVEGLAPGESVQSARFVGDRGYVVTFRQVDPLFVFDLSNPSEPRLLAALKIPGFSEYMHPLEGGTHLLTIGRDGNDDGQVFGTALQIFDVRDPRDPKLTHKHVLGEGWSEAEHNHKAFTFYEGMLAIPMVTYDANYGFAASTLELFDIDVERGIVPRASIDHTGFFQNMQPDYCYWYGYGVRRGVFIDEYVYSISEGGVIATPVAEPGVSAASLELPHTPSQTCGYY